MPWAGRPPLLPASAVRFLSLPPKRTHTRKSRSRKRTRGRAAKTTSACGQDGPHRDGPCPPADPSLVAPGVGTHPHTISLRVCPDELGRGRDEKAPPRNSQTQGNRSQGAGENQLVPISIRQFPECFMVLKIKGQGPRTKRRQAKGDRDRRPAHPPESRVTLSMGLRAPERASCRQNDPALEFRLGCLSLC